MRHYRKTTMKQIFHILCLLAVAALTACSQDDGTPASGDGGQLTIKFTADPATRTTLAGSDNVQHVKYVQVYVFEGTASDAAAATCVASEDAGWQQPQSGGAATQYYTLKTKLKEGTTYTVLAVGLDTETIDGKPTKDEGAGYVYALPGAIQPGQTTLATAIATLAQGRTAADMKHAELFAGSGEVTVEPNSNKITEITMTRRVAGVVMYLTNISPDVKRIKLQLHQAQNTQMPLIVQEHDFGGAPLTGNEADDRTLLDITITHDLLASEQVTGKDGTVICTKLPGSVLAGAYLIPASAPGEGGNTLTLIQYTSETPTDADIHRRQQVKLNNPKEGMDDTAYPLEANCIYSIGKKADGIDEPEDLEGTADADIYVDGNWQADIVIPM